MITYLKDGTVLRGKIHGYGGIPQDREVPRILDRKLDAVGHYPPFESNVTVWTDPENPVSDKRVTKVKADQIDRVTLCSGHHVWGRRHSNGNLGG